MIVICQICRNDIAETSPEELALPIKGSMFHSHRTGFPDPFLSPDLEWEHMKCRYCRQRPFLKPDEILTTDGLYQISAEVVEQMPVNDIAMVDDVVGINPIYACHHCGKAASEFKNKAGFLNHIRFCEKRNG